MKKDKGIVFDFNGVLWWDSALQEEAWVETSKKIRGRAFSKEEMSVHVHGRNNSYTLSYLAGRQLTDEEVEKLTDQKEDIYKQLCLDQGENFKLSPGAIELLDFLKDNNYPFTIATASGLGNVKFFFENLKLDKWFDLNNLVYDDGTFPGKPEPDMYSRGAQIIGLPPEDCMVIEDAKSGIESARRAKIGVIVALGPSEKHDQLKSLDGVDIVVENLGELVGYFAKGSKI